VVSLNERRNEHQVIAEAVAPVVYGTKINCAQCTSHPLAREIKLAHYWGWSRPNRQQKTWKAEQRSENRPSAVSSISPT